MFDIVTIGSATRDNFIKGDYPLIRWPKTPLGKAYALPFGEKLEVTDAYMTIGGNAVNASVTFARQGLKTACVAKTGDDVAAHELKERLQREKIDTRLMAISHKKPTAFSVLILENGERTILGYHGASDTFALRDILLSKLKAKWWYLSLAGESIKMYPRLIAFAQEHHIKIAFNPSGYHLSHRKVEIMRSLRYVDVLCLNEGEAAGLVGIPFKKERDVFRKIDKLLSPGIVVVTNGAKGATVSDGAHIYKAGIFPERKLVDRTGAGDAFGSGFIAALIEREAYSVKRRACSPKVFNPVVIQHAIRLASANATSVVEQIGATEGVLTKREFERSSRWRGFRVHTQRI